MLNLEDKWMQLAIKEAKYAQKYSEVPVGAVLINLKNNKLIYKSGNNVNRKSNPLAHAELEVIYSALKLLKVKYLYNTALYVTLEPCLMCAAAISEIRISKLYFGTYDEKKGSIENGARLYSQKSYFIPEVYGGILEDECSKVLKNFFKNIRKI